MGGANSAGAVALGNVFYLQCTLCTPPKPKFFTAVCCDPLMMVLINSHVNPFVLDRPKLLEAEVPIAASDHDFLSHDSFVCCSQLSFEYSAEQLDRKLNLEPGVYRGSLCESAHIAVRDAIVSSHILPKKYRARIAAAWDRV